MCKCKNAYVEEKCLRNGWKKTTGIFFNKQVSTQFSCRLAQGADGQHKRRKSKQGLALCHGVWSPVLGFVPTSQDKRVGQPVGFCTNSPRLMKETNILDPWLNQEDDRGWWAGSDHETVGPVQSCTCWTRTGGLPTCELMKTTVKAAEKSTEFSPPCGSHDLSLELLGFHGSQFESYWTGNFQMARKLWLLVAWGDTFWMPGSQLDLMPTAGQSWTPSQPGVSG